MLKRIPKSDISIRPFKAYKEWSFDQSSTEVSILEANNESSELTTNGFPKNSVYGQLRAQFYNGNEENPFNRTGHKSNIYTTASVATERYLNNVAKVISIPNIYIGEGIKKKSLTLYDNNTLFTDDGNGNLFDSRDEIIISLINNGIEPAAGTMTFDDIVGNTYSAVIDSFFFDIQTKEIILEIDGNEYTALVDTFDVETGIMIVNNFTFLPEEASGIKIGNVFYNQGLITLTRYSNTKLLSNWDLGYKSTETIYENEYLLIVNQDEFNVSQNPSAVVESGRETSYVTNTDNKTQKVTNNPGVKYIRKAFTMENGTGSMDYTYAYTGSIGNKKAGFEHWDVSGSIDTTGSFLAPFITTIGLYDDNCDLVAVAKLPQPIKSEPDIPINFIVRFDT
jgi:hypothetical protein